MADGRTATVRGTVIAEAGRLGTPPLFAIGDATAGLPIRVADGQSAPPRGTLVELRGTIAAPYGQTELRLAAGGLTIIGTGPVPVPFDLVPGAAGETTEGRLARTRGTVTVAAARATSGDLAFTIEGIDGVPLRILADASASLDPAALRKGARVTLTGIVGQRASRKGALDGYRLWVRDRSDVTITGSPAPQPSPSPSPTATSGAVPLLAIAAARLREGKRVTIEGTVTVDRSLLDASGRRTVVEDASGAIELYLDAKDTAISAGARVRATGVVGRAWGAPRLRVDAIRVLGRRTPVAHDLRVAPGAATEWRLVRVRGTIAEVNRSGDRWTAELVSGSLRVPLLGLPGAGITSSALVEGRTATVVGIVKRPYPTATDQRFAVVPRSRGDLDLGATGATAPRATAGGSGAPGASIATGTSSTGATGTAPDPGLGAGTDVPLGALADHLGATVRVGGLVTAVGPDGIRLDDGTATARLVFEGPAADLASLLQPGDAMNVSGTPEARDEVVLVVTDPAGLALLGELGGDVSDDGPASGAANPLAALGVVDGEDGPVVGRDAAVSAALAAGRGHDPALLALATLILTAALGGGLAAYRVALGRRRTRARIQARLDALAPTPPAGPPARA
ncbi:MAG TPA: OB-fold nucleic acid binding domain-containing protein [Candidatus Limnocylindrales bacterium]|nr:OB-fold nucleic acid binding domain-containing protein [Candidatus Limnocylindrales bacterium]